MLDTATDQGRALLDSIVTQQATVIAYQNDFKLLMILTLMVLPLAMIIGSTRTKTASGPAEVHALD
jgi:DHA2 family multidrug resistance protein